MPRIQIRDRDGVCVVCQQPVDDHFDNRNRWKGCHNRLTLAPASAPGALTPRRRETIRLADEIARAAIGLRQAACRADDDELMDEAQDVVAATRALATYLLQRTLTTAERGFFDV